MHHPDKHPIRGTLGFGEPVLGKNFTKNYSKIQGKTVAYFAKGSRDTYIA